MEYRKVCPNCGDPWHDGDKYCRFCGAPMTNPRFTPDRMPTIYGPPPMKRKHQCKQCGFTWTTCQMVDREDFCPKCGGPAPYVEEGEDESLWEIPPKQRTPLDKLKDWFRR